MLQYSYLIVDSSIAYETRSRVSKAAMVEMKELEAGSWWHRLVCEECVDVRGRRRSS